jgi:hypothetical protein
VTRPIYGYVYETILRGQTDAWHSYVGMTTTTIHQRVHGRSGHTSAPAVTKDPWKAGILPGRAGYRCLEIVRSTGDCAENERALRRAEAFWIDRLRPVHNDVRPVRPAGEVRRKPTSADASQRVSARSAPRRRRKPIRARAVLCALIVAVSIALVARFVVLMDLPWPAAPWVAAPVLGGAFGWTFFWRIHRAWRRLTR